MCDELLLGCIWVCSTGLFGMALSILTDIYPEKTSYITSDLFRFSNPLFPGMMRRQRWGAAAAKVTRAAHFKCSLSRRWVLLTICPSVFLSLHFTLISHPPLTLHPDVDEFIIWSTCTQSCSLPLPPLCPSPRSTGYGGGRACVFVSACQTRAYGVPSCQHMPEGFSMPVLARSRLSVCIAKARHAAVCRDKGCFPGFFSLPFAPPIFLPPLCITPFLWVTHWKCHSLHIMDGNLFFRIFLLLQLKFSCKGEFWGIKTIFWLLRHPHIKLDRLGKKYSAFKNVNKRQR